MRVKDRYSKMMRPKHLERLMKVVRDKPESSAHARRDHGFLVCLINMGLRIGEACRLERRHFEHLDYDPPMADVPALKKDKHKKSFRYPKNWSEDQRQGHLDKVVAKTGLVGQPAMEMRKLFDAEFSRSPSKEKVVHTEKIKNLYVRQEIARFIRAYIDELPVGQRYLFKGRKTCLSARMGRNIFYHYFNACKFRESFSPHSVRHGWGTLLYEWTKDQVFVRDQMGHATTDRGLSTTNIYMHLSPEAAEENLGKIRVFI
jgi:integrase